MIFSTRTQASAFYRFYPSPPLVLAVFAVDILSSCFCGFGWFSPAGVGIIEIVRVWLFSIGVFVISDVLQRSLARWTWLDNFMTDRGKSAKREKRMRELEDLSHRIWVLGHAQEMTPEDANIVRVDTLGRHWMNFVCGGVVCRVSRDQERPANQEEKETFCFSQTPDVILVRRMRSCLRSSRFTHCLVVETNC